MVAQIYAGFGSSPYSLSIRLLHTCQNLPHRENSEKSWVFFLRMPVRALSFHEAEGLLEVPR